MNEDFLGKDGCCLSCYECGKCSSPCYSCKCTKCDWYYDGNLINIKQRCYYLAMKKETIWFDYLKLIGGTEKAYLVSDNNIDIWIPKQFIKFKNNEIGITCWIADEKGLLGNGLDELDGEYNEYNEDMEVW